MRYQPIGADPVVERAFTGDHYAVAVLGRTECQMFLRPNSGEGSVVTSSKYFVRAGVLCRFRVLCAVWLSAFSFLVFMFSL